MKQIIKEYEDLGMLKKGEWTLNKIKKGVNNERTNFEVESNG